MEISKFKSRKEWSEAVWRKILEDIKNPELSAVLNSLLSRYEKNIIVNRLAAMALIKKGRTYQQIGNELWLSPVTISSLKKALVKNSKDGYKSQRTIKRSRTNQKPRILEKDQSYPAWLSRLDFYIENFPKKNGPRWKWVK